MKQTILGVYGASGFGRETLPLVRQQVLQNEDTTSQIVFIDDNKQGETLNGCSVLTYEEFLDISSNMKYVIPAVADSRIRQQLAEKAMADGVQLFHTAAENVVIMDEVEIGQGAILCPFVTLTSNVSIGKCFHANIYSYVAHDCRIGDYVTFAPGVKCNGNVIVKDHAYLGTGAIIRQGKPDQPLVIGKDAIVGMGAVVTRDVPPGAVVVGNPAKPMIKK